MRATRAATWGLWLLALAAVPASAAPAVTPPDPSTPGWSAAAALTVPQYYDAAAVLEDGSVLVTGGLAGSRSTAHSPTSCPSPASP